MSDRFKMIASGYALFIRDGKILLSRRCNTGFEDGKYSLPAGHIEADEKISEGTIREIREEIGINLQSQDLELAHVMHRKSKDERLDFFFKVKTWDGEIKNLEPNKCDDLSWFELEKLPDNTVDYVAFAIAQVCQNIFYSEYGW